MNARRRLLFLGAAFVIVAACAETDPGVTSSRADEVVAVTSPPETAPETVPATEPVETIATTTLPETTVPAVEPPSTDPLEPPQDTTPPPDPAEQLIDFGAEKTPQSYDNFLNAAFIDITEFWNAEFPAIYDNAQFVPVSHIFAHYPERSELPFLACVGEIPFENAEQNAFYQFCFDEQTLESDTTGDVIVYDDAFLFPELASRLGDAAVGIVVAHEYGHAISARAGEFDKLLPTVDTEQQADCFAGAWAAHVARGESVLLPAFGDEEVKAGLAAMIEVRDPVGSDVLDPNGHGTAFDRVGAFQEGFLRGTERCRDFTRGQPNPRIDLIFDDPNIDDEEEGDLPYDQILVDTPKSLDTFWLPTLEGSNVDFTSPGLVPFPTDGPYPECRGLTGPELKNRAVFCPESNTIAYDDNFVRELYDRLGDMAFAYPIASAYSDAVQKRLGFTLTGEPEVLLNDCLVGAWLVDIVPISGTDDATNPSQEILLAAGDLDEVVLTAVLLGDAETTTDVEGTAFEKIDAFRAGVLEGLAGCQARLG